MRRVPPDFTFVTYEGLPDLDPDDRLAVTELATRGLKAVPAVWNDPAVDWARAGICVIRSTWDYHLAHERFLQWAERVSRVTQLWNPLPIVRWNAHKRYMQELSDRGASVVPTAWLPAGSKADVAALLRAHGWNRAVVKPAIGLATRGVMRIDDAEESLRQAQAHVAALLEEYDVMVQPFMASVDSYGERALVLIEGAYSHATRKTAFQKLAAAGEAGETPVEADADEIAVARRVVTMVPEPWLYARVDLVRDDANRPIVIELELVEPSLFLGMHPAAPARFADALARLLRPREHVHARP